METIPVSGSTSTSATWQPLGKVWDLISAVSCASSSVASMPAAAFFRWMFFAAGPLEQAVTNRSLGVMPTAEQQQMVGYGDYDRVVSVLEAAVSAHPYIAGERFTAADVYVGSHVMWGAQFGTLPKRDAFMAYIGRLADRPAHRRASELDDAAMAEMRAAG